MLACLVMHWRRQLAGADRIVWLCRNSDQGELLMLVPDLCCSAEANLAAKRGFVQLCRLPFTSILVQSCEREVRQFFPRVP